MTLREQRLLEAIKGISEQLSELSHDETPLTDPALVQLSQRLDKLILKWYRLVGEGKEGRRVAGSKGIHP
ncbi:MAG: aspartyl-phosphate phosphatase Spo0E family protein [Firmicutes bacterium]|nr:aspartyl-phosphate phosphatase Spo0E family protein [Bacillota bacterium]